MFFANVSCVYSSCSASNTIKSNAAKKSDISFEFSKSKSAILKIDLINDFDNDSNDDENNNFVNKNNASVTNLFASKNNLIIDQFICKKSSKPVYFTSNFSRLPRVTYLSICIFRI